MVSNYTEIRQNSIWLTLWGTSATNGTKNIMYIPTNHFQRHDKKRSHSLRIFDLGFGFIGSELFGSFLGVSKLSTFIRLPLISIDLSSFICNMRYKMKCICFIVYYYKYLLCNIILHSP